MLRFLAEGAEEAEAAVAEVVEVVLVALVAIAAAEPLPPRADVESPSPPRVAACLPLPRLSTVRHVHTLAVRSELLAPPGPWFTHLQHTQLSKLGQLGQLDNFLRRFPWLSQSSVIKYCRKAY